MQAFGRSPERQAVKIQEVAARSAVLGKVVEKMLTKDPRQRISSAELANELQPGRLRRMTIFSDPLLESLSGVSLHEIKAVHTLRGELDGDDVDLSEISDYIGGSVALLRVVRDPARLAPSVECVRTMLAAREKLGSDAKAQELRQNNLTLHNLPGSERVRAATCQTNEWAGLDAQGDIVVFERWGAIIPATLLAELPVEQYSQWNAYRHEARAMVLDTLSRRARRVVRFAIVMDMKGTGAGHRKAIPYVNVFSAGDSTKVVPNMHSTTFFVRSGKVTAGIYATIGRMGILSANAKATTFFVAGPDPFAASTDFSTRFKRSALPAAVGGTLVTGAVSDNICIRTRDRVADYAHICYLLAQDEHCCVGVDLPAAADADAVWTRHVATHLHV